MAELNCNRTDSYIAATGLQPELESALPQPAPNRSRPNNIRSAELDANLNCFESNRTVAILEYSETSSIERNGPTVENQDAADSEEALSRGISF